MYIDQNPQKNIVLRYGNELKVINYEKFSRRI